MNIFIWVLAIAITVFISLLLAGSYFYNFAILRRKKEFMSSDPDLNETKSGVHWESNKEWLQLQAQEEWNIKAFDDLSLYALYLPCPTPTDKTVILVHGYNSWHGSMGSFAQYYLKTLGCNVLMPDLRGHGKSQGTYIGFGWYDRKDMLRWIDALQSKGNDQIILHGVSMGGSTVLAASGESLPNDVKCVISDCAFSSMAAILGYQTKRMFKLPKFPFMYFTSFFCKLRAGFYIKEASAIDQVKKSVKPTLFIHGSADRFVPVSMVYELFEAAGCPKQLLVVQDAAHGTAFWKDPAAYKTTMENFLRLYLKEGTNE